MPRAFVIDSTARSCIVALLGFVELEVSVVAGRTVARWVDVRTCLHWTCGVGMA